MTISEMFGQSGVLMLLGMAVVFLFLIILVASITVAGRVIHAAGWDRDTAAAAQSRTVLSGVDGAVVAAITAAVTAYRQAESAPESAPR